VAVAAVVGVGWFLACGLPLIACLVLALSHQWGHGQSTDQDTVCPANALFSASVVVGRLVEASLRGGGGLRTSSSLLSKAARFQ
jgi:hypothetical protein